MSKTSIVNTRDALLHLWSAAAGTLRDEELDYYAKLTGFAELEVRNISTTLSTLANLAANVGEADQPNRDEITQVLYSTSYQLDALAALIEIADCAAYCLETSRKAKEKSIRIKKPD